MIRRFVLVLIAVASSGCFDFDAAYSQFCDGGRCASAGGGTGGSAGGGGGETGGGGGGDAMGGGGGGALGGGGGTAVDAGCTQFLCAELDWKSPRAGEGFRYFAMAPGLNLQSLGRFNVYASFQTSNFVNHVEYRFNNGTVTSINRNGFPGGIDARHLAGISLTDQWFNYNGYAQHIVGNASPQQVAGCSLPDGGVTSPSHHAALPLSAEEVWLVGHPMSVCHWTPDGGAVQTAEAPLMSNVYLLDAYRAPSGELFVAGGDYQTGDGVCFISNELGVPYPVTPAVIDDYYTDGCSSIDGVGTQVYALARDDSAAHGKILELRDGGFVEAFTAPYRLAQLDVLTTGEIWAVGASGTSAIYFDGGAWAEVTLPLTENRFNVTWENVAGTSEGIVLTGYEEQPDGGIAAVVNSYRRLGQ